MEVFKITSAKPIVSFCFFTKSCLFSLKHGLQGGRFLLLGMFNIFLLVEMLSLNRKRNKALHELLKLVLMWEFVFVLFCFIKQLARTLLTKLTNLPFLAGETFSMIKALN